MALLERSPALNLTKRRGLFIPGAVEMAGAKWPVQHQHRAQPRDDDRRSGRAQRGQPEGDRGQDGRNNMASVDLYFENIGLSRPLLGFLNFFLFLGTF